MTRKIKRTKQIGYSEIVFVIEVDEGEYLDTKVIINDQLLCVIAGDTIEEFTSKLQALVNEFRI